MNHFAFVGLGLGLAIVFALLPGRVIFWTIPVVGIGAAIYLAIRWLVSGNRTTSRVVALLALLVLLVVTRGAPLLLGGLLLLIASSVVIALYPTAINLGLSYLTVQLLPKNRIFAVTGFVLISLVLGFNVRIPGMVDDWLSARQPQPASVTKRTLLSQDESLLLVSNVDQIDFRDSPSEPIGLDGNEGCGCYYWVYPRMITEGVEDALQRNGIRYTKIGKSRYKLVINSSKHSGVTLLRISLWDGPSRTASYQSRLRTAYALEDRFADAGSHDIDYLPHRLLFLAQNNVWNYLLSVVSKTKTKSPIKEFLAKAIQVTQPPGQQRTEQAVKVNGEMEAIEHAPYIGKQVEQRETGCGDNVKVSLRYDPYPLGSGKEISFPWTALTFRQGSETFSALVPRETVRVICANSFVYAISGLLRNEFIVQKFSARGTLLANHAIVLPLKTYGGYQRKPVIDFLESENGYEFTLLDVAEAPAGYYFDVKEAYRVHAPLATNKTTSVAN